MKDTQCLWYFSFQQIYSLLKHILTTEEEWVQQFFKEINLWSLCPKFHQENITVAQKIDQPLISLSVSSKLPD